jgi:hypothetical protein
VFVEQGTAFYSPVELSLDENKKSLNDLVNLLSPDASVLTQNLVFPHVSNRLNAYAIPFSDYGQPEEMHGYIRSMLNNCEYVLLDTTGIDDMSRFVIETMTENDAYGPYALGSQSVLYKRGFHSEPLYSHYTSDRTFLAYRDLKYSVEQASVVSDSSSISGEVVSCPKGEPGHSIFGPYIYLLQGAYDATFTVKTENHDSGWLGTFDITSGIGSQILSFRDAYGFEFKAGEWTNITVPFSLSRLTTGIELRFFNRGNATFAFDRVILKRITSSSTAKTSMMTMHIRDLKLRDGNVTEEGFLLHQQGVTGEVFWYGPYWSFDSGNYSATFLMRIAPTPQEQGKHVLTLSISGKLGEANEPISLCERALYTQDFITANNVSDWQSLDVDFTVEKPMLYLEFRGLLDKRLRHISRVHHCGKIRSIMNC